MFHFSFLPTKLIKGGLNLWIHHWLFVFTTTYDTRRDPRKRLLLEYGPVEQTNTFLRFDLPFSWGCTFSRVKKEIGRYWSTLRWYLWMWLPLVSGPKHVCHRQTGSCLQKIQKKSKEFGLEEHVFVTFTKVRQPRGWLCLFDNYFYLFPDGIIDPILGAQSKLRLQK